MKVLTLKLKENITDIDSLDISEYIASKIGKIDLSIDPKKQKNYSVTLDHTTGECTIIFNDAKIHPEPLSGIEISKIRGEMSKHKHFKQDKGIEDKP